MTEVDISSPSKLAQSKISAENPSAYSVKEGILARQKRIQELFSGRAARGAALPEVGKFTKAELARQHRERTYERTYQNGLPLTKAEQARQQQERIECAIQPNKNPVVIVVEEEDPTEDCTENLDDSASWGSGTKVQQQQQQQQQQAEPESWGKYSHGRPQAAAQQQQLAEPEAWRKYSPGLPQAATKAEVVYQKSVLTDEETKQKRVMRKTVHKELIRTYQECVKIQDEHDEKRKEKYGKNVAILTEAPLDERAEKRKLRLQQAKERIQREQEHDALKQQRKLEKFEVVEQRQKAYETYLHMGMPAKKKFEERVAANTNEFEVTPADIELLPWLDGEFSVDVAALTRLQRRDELASDSENEESSQ